MIINKSELCRLAGISAYHPVNNTIIYGLNSFLLPFLRVFTFFQMFLKVYSHLIRQKYLYLNMQTGIVRDLDSSWKGCSISYNLLKYAISPSEAMWQVVVDWCHGEYVNRYDKCLDSLMSGNSRPIRKIFSIVYIYAYSKVMLPYLMRR